MQTETIPDKMNRQQAADYLGVSPGFLANDVWTQRHKVPFQKIGRRCIYPRQMLDAWLATRTVNAPSGKAGGL